MADKSQRTEKPTAQHKKKMREKGSVARSQELAGWASLMLVTSMMPSLGDHAATRISQFTQQVTQAMAHPDVATATSLLGRGLSTAVEAVLPILLVGGGLAVAISFAQVGLRFTPKALSFKFSKISPKAGFSRLFSSQGLWTLAKTLMKLVVLSALGYVVLHKLVHSMLGSSTIPLQATLGAAGTSIISMMRYVGALALLIAAGDYYFQRRSYQQSLRMTKQEVKDEHRQNDGNPEVRRAMRSKARRLSRMHIRAALAGADVVVTNPTHFAVAIAYDRDKDRAPRVVAKGSDYNAATIREVAREFHVVIVENPPLARTLFATCGVDDVVPVDLYAAVARLLAFVYALTPASRAFRDVHQMAV